MHGVKEVRKFHTIKSKFYIVIRGKDSLLKKKICSKETNDDIKIKLKFVCSLGRCHKEN
jgi:hypothetical protein